MPDSKTDKLVASAKTAIRRLGDHAHYDINALSDLLALTRNVDRAALDAIIALRARGYSWERIGDTLGVTRQAAIMRWGRLASEDAMPAEGAQEATANTTKSTTMANVSEHPNFVNLGSLREGDTILCPDDGISETVTAIRPYNSHVKVWTTRDPHFRPKDELVRRV